MAEPLITEADQEEDLTLPPAPEVAPAAEGVPQEPPPPQPIEEEVSDVDAKPPGEPPVAPAEPVLAETPPPEPVNEFDAKIAEIDAKDYNELYAVTDSDVYKPAHRPLTVEGAEQYLKINGGQDDRADPNTLDLLSYAASDNILTRTLIHDATSGAISNIALDYLAPELLKEDPNFKIDETDPWFMSLPPHQQRQMMESNNEIHSQLIKNRILREQKIADEFSRSGWVQWTSASVLQLVLEGGPIGLAGRGISAVTGAGRAINWAATGFGKAAQLAQNSRYLGAVKGSMNGLAGASTEAFISYNMNVIGENEALTQAALGTGFGGVIGAIKPSWMGVHRVDVDPVAAKAETIDAQAAFQAKQARERGEVVVYGAEQAKRGGDPDAPSGSTALTPHRAPLDGDILSPSGKDQTGTIRNRHADDAEFEDLSPENRKTTTAETKGADPEDLIGSRADDAPQIREVIFKSDAKQVVRERGQSKNATAHLDNDAEFLDDAFGILYGKMSRANADMQKLFANAWRRQGYRNEAARKVWTIAGKRADDFAARSGDDVRHGWDSKDAAMKNLEEGEELVQVELPEGTKIIEGGDVLADRVGEAGQIMFGGGKLDGGRFKAGRTIPKGNPDMLRGKYADGRPMPPEAIARRNSTMEDLNKQIDDPEKIDPIDPNEAGSGIGADRVMDDKATVLTSENATKWAQDPANAPMREGFIGLSRVVRMMQSKNPYLRLGTRMLFGDSLISTGKDRGGPPMSTSGLSTEQMLRQAFDQDQDLITDVFRYGEAAYYKELTASGRKAPKGRKLKKEFSVNLKEWQAYKNAGRTADYTAKYGTAPPKSIQDAGKKLDDWNKSILEDMQDPGAKYGKSGSVPPVAGADQVVWKEGYFPQQVSSNKIAAWANKGFPDALNQVLKRALYNKALQTNPNVKFDDFEAIANLISDAMYKGGTTNFYGSRVPSFKTAEDLIQHAQNSGLNLSPARMQQLRDSFDLFVGQSKEATSNLKERMDIDILQKYTVNGKGGKTEDLSMLDLLEDDLMNSHQNYSRTHRGWTAMANSYIPDKETGKAQTVQVPVDPQDPTKGMKDQYITFSNMQQVNQYLHDLERIHTDLQLDRKNWNPFTQNTDGEPSLWRQGDRDIMRESMMWMINQSGEKPSRFAQVARMLTFAQMLGKGGMSTLQESMSYLGRTGVHGAMRYVDDRTISAIVNTFDDLSGGRIGKSQLGIDGFLRSLQDFGQGTELKRLRSGTAFDHGNSVTAGSMATLDDSWTSFASYHVERFQNGVMNTSGLIPLHSYFSTQASRGTNDMFASWAAKYKTMDKLPKRHKNRLQDAGIDPDDFQEIMDFYNKVAVKKKRLGVTQVEDFDIKHPDFNQVTLNKILHAVTREAENYGMIEATYGAKLQGGGTSLGAIVTALKTTQFASGTQMLANWGKSTAENTGNLTRNLRQGKISGPDGAYNDAMGLAQNGQYLIMAIASAYVYAIVRQEYDMFENGLSDKQKAEWRSNYGNPNWIYRETIDRSGLLSLIPLAYDSLAAPMMGAKDWKGFDTSGVKSGFGSAIDGPGSVMSDLVVGSTPMGMVENWTKAADGIGNHLTGQAVDRDNANILKAFSNLWYARLGLNAFHEAVDMPEGKKRKFKPTAPHNTMQQALSAKRSTSKHIGEQLEVTYDKANKFFFGD